MARDRMSVTIGYRTLRQ